MIKTAQNQLFKLASVFARKLLSFGQAASPADIITLEDAVNFLLAPLDGEMFVYLGEDPLDFIKSIYLKKAFIFHPDRNSDDLNATNRLATLNTAYNNLKYCNRFKLISLLNKYSSKASSETFSTSTSEEYSTHQRPGSRSRGRSSLFDPLSDEEMENLESAMGGRRTKTPETPAASETTETSKPKPKPRTGGLFGGLSKEQLSKIKF